MHYLRRIQALALIAVFPCWAESVSATTVRIDYSTDTNFFFGNGNPQGATAGLQAKAALDAAAGFYSGILNDTLRPIQPPTFQGAQGTVTWRWIPKYIHPATALKVAVDPGPPIAADEYVVYVGARSLPGATIGVGGPGDLEPPPNYRTTGFISPQEAVQVAAIDAQFRSDIMTRGETSGFARWGGSFAVDNDGSTNWHFNHTTAVADDKIDFYSVALHELAHTLGFGTTTEWNNFVSGTAFVGPVAMGEYFAHGPVPLASVTDKGHWSAMNTASKVLTTGMSQQSLMTPAFPPEIRRHLTRLDAAALVDIGWEIDLPQQVPGDYNGNGLVDAGDYSVWRNTLGSTTDLRANGNNSGPSTNKIDQADYAFWKSQFGNGAGGGGGSLAGSGSASVPEPTGMALVILGAILALLCESRLTRR